MMRGRKRDREETNTTVVTTTTTTLRSSDRFLKQKKLISTKPFKSKRKANHQPSKNNPISKYFNAVKSNRVEVGDGNG